MADRTYDINVNVNSPIMQNAVGAAQAGGTAAPMPPGVMQAHARAQQQLNEEFKRRIPPLDNLFKTIGIEVSLKSLLKQSQIFTSTVGSLFQMFGAMVDVILAPFAKYIVIGIQKFAEWIPKIGKFAEWVERNIVSRLVDFMKNVWNWMRYPGDWLPFGGLGMPKKPKPGEQKSELFSIQNIKDAEGPYATLVAVIKEGFSAAIGVGIPIIWGVGALALFVGAMALIRKVPDAAAWFAKSFINILTSAPARFFGKKGFQMTGGFLGKESMETIGDMSIEDFQKKWAQYGGDVDVAGGVPPRAVIPQGQLDQLDRIMKILGIDDYGEITPEIFKNLDIEVQDTLTKISKHFTTPPWSETPANTGTWVGKIVGHITDLFVGGGTVRKGGIIGLFAAGVAGIIAVVKRLFEGGTPLDPPDIAARFGARVTNQYDEAVSEGGTVIPHRALTVDEFAKMKEGGFYKKFSSYDEYITGHPAASLPNPHRASLLATPGPILATPGTAIAIKYTSSLDATQIKAARDAITDLREGSQLVLARQMQDKLNNPLSRLDDELIKGMISGYQQALAEGTTLAAINDVAGGDLYQRLKGAWAITGNNRWAQAMVEGGQLSMVDLGLAKFSGLSEANLLRITSAQSSAKAFKMLRAARGAMPMVGAGAAALWQYSQWTAQKKKMREDAHTEWKSMGSYGEEPPGYTHNPLEDFPAFLKSVGIDAGNFIGAILGVPTAFLGFQAGMGGQVLSEALSSAMNIWSGRDWEEGTLIELGQELMKLLPEEGRLNVQEFQGMGHQGWGLSDFFQRIAAGSVGSGFQGMGGDPYAAQMMEDYRRQSREAYEQNQAQITIKMLNNEERTIWTGNIFDAQVFGNKDWERLEVDNGTAYPDVYMVKIDRGVFQYLNPWNWGAE